MYVCKLLMVAVIGGGSALIPSQNNFLPTNCRMVVWRQAITPLACARVTRSDIGQEGLLKLDEANWADVNAISQDTYVDPAEPGGSQGVYNDLLMDYLVTATQAPGLPSGGGKQNPTIADSMTRLDPNKLPGACRWDAERSNTLGSDQACLCPATKSTCSVDRSECYWYQMPEEKALRLKNQGVGYVPTFACINSAERFYYLLAGLLKKRGKKDFAIKIRYGATPARGQLPLGPYGPAIIGGGSFSSRPLALQNLGRQLLQRFSG